MLKVGEIVLLREEHTNYLSNTKCSPLETYTQATLYRSRMVYLCKNVEF